MDGSKYTGNFWCDKHHGDGVEAMQYDGFVGKLPQNVIHSDYDFSDYDLSISSITPIAIYHGVTSAFSSITSSCERASALD